MGSWLERPTPVGCFPSRAFWCAGMTDSGGVAHDVAEDMLAAGLASVTMVQRSATLVVPIEHYSETHLGRPSPPPPPQLPQRPTWCDADSS